MLLKITSIIDWVNVRVAYLGWDFIESRSARACYALVCCIVHFGNSSPAIGFDSLRNRLISDNSVVEYFSLQETLEQFNRPPTGMLRACFGMLAAAKSMQSADTDWRPFASDGGL